MGLRIIPVDRQMTLQAVLILVGKFRQLGLKFVAQAAFFLLRSAENRPTGFVFFSDLIVRVVTLNAVFETLPKGRFLPAVTAFGDFIEHIIMTGCALFTLKKVF